MQPNPYQPPSLPGDDAPRIMVCQLCGVEAPTKYVEFYQNIGGRVHPVSPLRQREPLQIVRPSILLEIHAG